MLYLHVMKNIITYLFLSLCANCASAQVVLDWQKFYGGSSVDYASSILSTADGGYILSGNVQSNDGDVTDKHIGILANDDCWITKLSATGTIEWSRSLGGDGSDRSYNIIQTADGGYITVASTNSTNGDVSQALGYYDIWVVKLTATGAIEWERSYGGSATDEAGYIAQTADGGYIIGGQTRSIDGDATGHPLVNQDCFVLKITATGNVEWKKIYGGGGEEYTLKIRQTADGGYILCAITNSNDGDIIGSHNLFEGWIVKLNATGNMEWSKCIGGTGSDVIYDIRQTPDMGYIAVGSGESTDGDFTGSHGSEDAIIVKLNAAGDVEWKKIVGGKSDDVIRSVALTADGGYMTLGKASSIEGDLSAAVGQGKRIWLAKFSATGTLLWNGRYGSGEIVDDGLCLEQTDGGFIATGHMVLSLSSMPGYHGSYDIWVAKFNICSLAAPVVTVSSGVLSAPLGYASYQWNNEATGYITGATNATYTPVVPGTYNVVVTDAADCSAMSGNYTFTLDVPAVTANKFVGIYPNPARVNDIVRTTDVCNITVVNAYGQVVFQQNSTDIIRLSAFAPGIYYVKLEARDGTASVTHLSLY